MSSFRNYLAQTIRAAALVATLAPTLAAAAETVEVVPGVQVTKRTYSAPTNEQPFFGFAVKSPEDKAADEKFVDAIVAATGSRETAFEETYRAAGYGKPRSGLIRRFSFHPNRAPSITALR
jgi:hypothetical protein